MSASERLKALESQIVPGMAGDVRKLAYALPQIVAVVEAAELEAALAIINDERETSLGHALAALDEQLGDLGSATEPETPTPRRKIVKADRSDLEEWKP